MKAVAVSVWAVCLDGGRGGDIEDSHSGKEAGGQRCGGRDTGLYFRRRMMTPFTT